MKQIIRAFIAVELPEDVQRGLAKVQRNLEMPGLSVRWVKTDAMHLTLKFLGDIKRDDLPELGKLMREAVKGIEPFPLAVEGLGSFPPVRSATDPGPQGHPKILWVGITGEVATLGELASRLEQASRGLGAKVEERRFVPHLTLGRIRSAPADFPQKFAEMKPPKLGGFIAEGITLFMSELTDEGGVHSPLDHVEFEG